MCDTPSAEQDGVKPTNIIKSTEAQTAVIAPEGKGKCAHKLSYSQVERGKGRTSLDGN